MPAERDIEIYQGDTYAHQLTLKNNANAVINITSRTYSGQIRKRRSSTTITATFATEITDGANGVVVFTLLPAITCCGFLCLRLPRSKWTNCYDDIDW